MIAGLALPELLLDSSTCGEGLCPKTVPVVRLSGGLELPLELAESFPLSQSEACTSMAGELGDVSKCCDG